MPYSIVQNDGRYCVVKDDDGENMGCHDTESEAQDQIAALYANEKSVSTEELKSFAIRAEDAELDGNQFRGVPSVMGNKDDGDDVIAPGAFEQKVLDDFITEGMVPIGHDWMDLPVAMPTAIKEQGNKLIAKAEFHTFQKAQDARTVMMERLAKGKSVGLSIGFQTGESKTFDNGDDLLKFIGSEQKADLSLYDEKGLKGYKNPVRLITKIARLFEFSIVSVPMNRLAVATAAKNRISVYSKEDFDSLKTVADFEGFLREVGLTKEASRQFVFAFKANLLRCEAESESEAKTDSAERVESDEAAPITPTPQVRRILFSPSDGRIIPCL